MCATHECGELSCVCRSILSLSLSLSMCVLSAAVAGWGGEGVGAGVSVSEALAEEKGPTFSSPSLHLMPRVAYALAAGWQFCCWKCCAFSNSGGGLEWCLFWPISATDTAISLELSSTPERFRMFCVEPSRRGLL